MTYYWIVLDFDRVYQTLNQIRELAEYKGQAVKFFDDQGFLIGTAFPDGSVQW